MMFNVAKFLLNLLYSILVTGILPHIITQLNSRTTRSSSDLDDDIERLGLCAV